jgi:hypothetical protein
MPEGGRIIAATDNDPDGRTLAEAIGQIVQATARTDLTFEADLPEGEGSDWNDQIRSCHTTH